MKKKIVSRAAACGLAVALVLTNGCRMRGTFWVCQRPGRSE